MPYHNPIIQRLSNDLFAPLHWLDRLEEQQHSGCDSCHPDSALAAALHTTLTGLDTTLQQLLHRVQQEQALLFSLIERAGQAAQLKPLYPRWQAIITLTQQLLDALAAIHTLPGPSQRSPCTESHSLPQRHAAELWDEITRLVAQLSHRLVRYLYAAETDYLPLADFLLGPSGNLTMPVESYSQSAVFPLRAHSAAPAATQLAHL